VTASDERQTAEKVMAGIVTGVGFLGAGMIFRDGDTMRGIGLIPAMLLVAAVVLLTFPLAWKLTRVLSAVASDSGSRAGREVL
jgi:hypothetical protein